MKDAWNITNYNNNDTLTYFPKGVVRGGSPGDVFKRSQRAPKYKFDATNYHHPVIRRANLITDCSHIVKCLRDSHVESHKSTSIMN